MAVEAAAITPSLLYTFVFNNLVTVARRRVQKAVLVGIEKTKRPRIKQPPETRTETLHPLDDWLFG